MGLFSNARPSASRPRRGEDGYVLLTLMLMVTMLVIAAAAVMPTIAFEIRRDREQEMIHRGVQYSRAIRNYYKKYGRYPTRLEDLDNTNNLRYLRKHYKDPVTGQDFKLLHYGDPGLSMTGSIGGGGIAGANSVSQMNGQAGSASAFGGSGSAFSQSSSFGGNSNSAFGGGSSFRGGSVSVAVRTVRSEEASAAQATLGLPAVTQPQAEPADSSTAQTHRKAETGVRRTHSLARRALRAVRETTRYSVEDLSLAWPASSKKDTIREFNHKNKYNEWQFVYDPTLDRGGLILTPVPASAAVGSRYATEPERTAGRLQVRAAVRSGNRVRAVVSIRTLVRLWQQQSRTARRTAHRTTAVQLAPVAHWHRAQRKTKGLIMR